MHVFDRHNFVFLSFSNSYNYRKGNFKKYMAYFGWLISKQSKLVQKMIMTEYGLTDVWSSFIKKLNILVVVNVGKISKAT